MKCQLPSKQEVFGLYQIWSQQEFDPKTTTKSEYAEFFRTLAWCISNLCRHGGVFDNHMHQILECLNSLLNKKLLFLFDETTQHKHESFGYHISWSLFCLTKDIDHYNSKIIDIMNENGICIQ